MARPLRLEYSGAVYHVAARGNGRQDVLRDDQDRKSLSEAVESVVEKTSWLCRGCCRLAEIPGTTGLHYSSISRIVNANNAHFKA